MEEVNVPFNLGHLKNSMTLMIWNIEMVGENFGILISWMIWDVESQSIFWGSMSQVGRFTQAIFNRDKTILP